MVPDWISAYLIVVLFCGITPGLIGWLPHA